MNPTQEQDQIVSTAVAGRSIKVEALSGSGKTSSQVMIADAKPTRERGLYLSFNKAIATEAARKFPRSVISSTIHSQAFRALGKKFSHRLEGSAGGRLSPMRLLNEYKYTGIGGLPALTRAGFVLKTLTNFLATPQEEPTSSNVPMKELRRRRSKESWNDRDLEDLARTIAVDAARAWQDMCREGSRLPMSHDGYLKLWVDSNPTLPYDYVLLDEAQDASLLMLKLIENQSAQKILVGDRNQQIYEWRGAVNIMQRLDMETLYLTQSFRFGDRIASAANPLLQFLESPRLMRGFECDRSGLPVTRAMLFRTNGGVFTDLVERTLSGNQAVHVEGGVQDLRSMVKGVESLMAGHTTLHPDFIGFDNWDDYREASEEFNAPAEMRLLVKVVDEHGLGQITKALEHAANVTQEEAHLTLSTAHKSKGREWTHVGVGDDFELPCANPLADDGPFKAEEVRLQYVALTRAQVELYGARTMVETYAQRAELVERLGRLTPQSTPSESVPLKTTGISGMSDDQATRVLNQLSAEERHHLDSRLRDLAKGTEGDCPREASVDNGNRAMEPGVQ